MPDRPSANPPPSPIAESPIDAPVAATANSEVVRPPRLDARTLLLDLVQEITSWERGLAYTFRLLTRAPHLAVTDYIERRDARLIKPMRYFLICFAVYALIGSACNWWAVHQREAEGLPPGRDWIRPIYERYRLVLMLALIPVISAAFRRANPDSGYNLAERWVFALYVFAQFLLWASIPDIVGALVRQNPTPAMLEFLPTFYVFWAFSLMVKGTPWVRTRAMMFFGSICLVGGAVTTVLFVAVLVVLKNLGLT